jgi:hypothetical protein
VSQTYCELDTDYEFSKIGERFDHLDNFNLHVILKVRISPSKMSRKLIPLIVFPILTFKISVKLIDVVKTSNNNQ